MKTLFYLLLLLLLSPLYLLHALLGLCLPDPAKAKGAAAGVGAVIRGLGNDISRLKR